MDVNTTLHRLPDGHSGIRYTIGAAVSITVFRSTI
jgi:hypothetical protein